MPQMVDLNPLLDGPQPSLLKDIERTNESALAEARRLPIPDASCRTAYGNSRFRSRPSPGWPYSTPSLTTIFPRETVMTGHPVNSIPS